MFVSVVIMIFIVVTYRGFIDSVDKYRSSAESLQAKQIISADLNSNIEKIKLLYYTVMLTSNKKKLLSINIKRLTQTIAKAQKLIAILEHGGVYQKSLPLNIAGQDMYAEAYHYTKPKFSIEAIRLKPKIEWLAQKSDYLEKLMQERIYVMAHHRDVMEPLSRIRNEISLFTKSIDSIFKRMEEDSNKLFFEAQKELTQQKALAKQTKEKHNILIYSAVFLLLLNILLGAYYFIRALRHKLYTDNLTQLYSRVKLEELPFDKHSLLLFIDIDDFSDINGLYGNEAGDQVLRCLADRIKEVAPKAMHFRVSGDVFGLYFSDMPLHTDSITKLIKDIRGYIYRYSRKKKICKEEISVTVGAAMGENCLHDAFMALDIAGSKKEPYHIFGDESEFKKEIEFNRYWHRELVRALDEDDILPFFQPIVDQALCIIGHEALMRLRKHDNEEIVYVSPMFLGVASKTKQYLPISQKMIEKTFIYFSNVKSSSFSVNLSSEDIETKSARDFLKSMIVQYDIANRVVFEILESSFVENQLVLQEFIAEFKSYGVRFAIDDFGSGYSNSRRVVNLNPDYIKIDGELVQNMLEDQKSYKMIESIVSYAQEFHIKTVAEHVSSPEIFEACKELGIDYFQGYLFAEPTAEIATKITKLTL
jgi:diguanylate cyclase (GGDEF)-like protein